MIVSNYNTDSKSTFKWTEIEKHIRALIATGNYLTAQEKARFKQQQLANIGLKNAATSPIEQPQPILTDTLQAE